MSATRVIDLHVHTSFSDGTYTPSATIEKASNRGLAAVAITDHDTVAGVQEAVEQGHRSGVEIVAGVELSAVAGDKSLHLLGYGLQVESPELLEKLQDIQKARDRRNQGIIEKLQEMGFTITMEELEVCSNGGQAGRPHLARLLHQKNIVHTPEDAFRRFLGKDCAAYVPRKTLTTGEAIAIIRQAGGLAVLAHPLTLGLDDEALVLLINQLKKDGLAGLEVFYPNHNRESQERLLGLCRKFDLLITGGSDFHGRNKPNIRMGRVSGNQTIPYQLLDHLKTRLREDLCRPS